MSSYATALSQALAAHDAAALDACFAGRHRLLPPSQLAGRPTHSLHAPASPSCSIAVHEEAVVSSSVARLSATQPAALLEALVERLQLHPQQAARLVPWFRSLLLCHGAALAAVPAGQVGAGAVASAADLPPGCNCKRAGGEAQRLSAAKAACWCCLQAALRAAHDILQERTACYSGLLGLSGRLQLLQADSGGVSSAEPPAAAAKVRRA